MSAFLMLLACWLGQPVAQDQVDEVVQAARADLKENAFDEAAAKLEPALEAHPESAVLWRLLGEATLMQAESLRSQGVTSTLIVASFRDAADHFARAIALEKERPSAESHALLARAQFLGGQIAEAAQSAERAVELEPDNVDHRLTLGGIRYQLYVEDQSNEELLKQARDTYAKAVEIDPKSVAALNGLAYCFALGGEDSEAVAHYEKSLRLEPAQPEVHTTLFQILGKEGDYSPLVELYDRLQPSHPESAALHYYRGYALLSNGQLAEAELAFHTAVTKDESYAEWVRPQLAKAKLQEAQRYADSDLERAAELVLAALKTAPDDEGVQQMVDFIGGKYMASGDQKGAAEFFEKAVELEKDNADWWNNYALLSRDTGQYEESYRAYKEALRLQPEDPRLLNDTALIQHYHLKNDLAEAKRFYEKAIELAEEQLEDPYLGDEQRSELQVALRDAKTNLDRLENGRGRRSRNGR